MSNSMQEAISTVIPSMVPVSELFRKFTKVDGQKRKVITPNGRLYTPTYNSRNMQGGIAKGFIRANGISVSGHIFLYCDPPVFKPIGINADMLGSWEELNSFVETVMMEAYDKALQKYLHDEPLTDKDTAAQYWYEHRNDPPTLYTPPE